MDSEALALFAETTQHAMFQFGPDGRVEWVNQAFLRSRHTQIMSVIGLPFADLLHPPVVRPEVLKIALHQIAKGECFQFETCYGEGPEVSWGSVECRPVFRNGQLLAFFAIESDITERKRAEALFERERALLDATTALATVGGYRMELATGEESWTDSMFAIHEISLGPIPSFDEIVKRFPPATKNKLVEVKRALMGDGVPGNFEVEFVTAKGNHKWVRSVVTPQYINGACVAIVGAVQDVTAGAYASGSFKASQGRSGRGEPSKGAIPCKHES